MKLTKRSFGLLIVACFLLTQLNSAFAQSNELQTVIGKLLKDGAIPKIVDGPEPEPGPARDRSNYPPITLEEFDDTPQEPYENAIVTVDRETGETTTIPLPQGNGTLQDFSTFGGPGVLAKLLEEPAGFPRSFTGFTEIFDPTAFPWLVNVKLFVDFPNNNGGVCSGVLIHPRYVLTAAHCMWPSDLSLGTFTNVDAVPAFENGDSPFGTANWRRVTAFQAWTQDRIRDWDIAIIELDRPVGAVTGWFAYGFNTNNAFYSGRTMNNPGYPAASPFDGQTMQFRSGTYDSFFTHRFEFQPRCFGGHSGSGSYYIDNGNRFVHGVHSYSSGDGLRSGQIRLTQAKFDTFQNAIAGTTSTSPDLVPLDVNCSSSATAGSAIPTFDFLIYNESSATWNSGTSFDIYLSDNDFISTGDTFLGTVTSSTAIGPNGRLRITTSNVPVPSSVASGSYYVGGIVTSSDSDSGNNRTLADDVCEISITGSAPPNDNFFNAFAINAPGSASGTNVNGTFETGEPQGGSGSAAQSVWWTVVAPASGTMTIDTIGSDFDTILDVFTGASVSNLTPVVGGFNDDFSGLQSLVEIEVVAGQSYEIRVSGFGSSQGNISLSTDIAIVAPPNDNFANSIAIAVPSTNVGSNLNGTFEAGEPQGGSGSAARSVWWNVVAPASGTMTIDTIGSNFDTILDVFTGTSVSNLTPVVGGFNDDFSGFQSLVEIEVVAGQRYEIRVSGFGSSEGSIALNIEFIAGDILVVPSAYTVFRGIEITGALANFVESDNVRALYNPGFTLNDTEAPVWLVFTGTAFANEFIVESSAGTPGLTYTVEAFNWDTGIYNSIGQEPESFNADSINVFQMAIEHVDVDNSVETRVGWRQTGFTINFPWEVRVDQVGWNVF